jgi:hypothetical protein
MEMGDSSGLPFRVQAINFRATLTLLKADSK